MESDEDPLLVKFLISSLEFEKLKYYESKCQQLSAELEKLKLDKSEQVGGGKFVVESNAIDSLETPALKEIKDSEDTLINYSVPIVKNQDYDDYDESALLHLIAPKDQFKAKFLLQQIKDRGSELTWNSSGVVFINKISIPNSNVFVLYPHLFQNTLPRLEIPGLKEVVKKLEIMGLAQYIGLHLPSTDLIQGSGLSIEKATLQSKDENTQQAIDNNIPNENEEKPIPEPAAELTENSSWWFLE